MIKGWKNLSRNEIDHLKFSACNSTIGFQNTIDEHVLQRLEHPTIEPCFECKAIARKLGMEGNAGAAKKRRERTALFARELDRRRAGR